MHVLIMVLVALYFNCACAPRGPLGVTNKVALESKQTLNVPKKNCFLWNDIAQGRTQNVSEKTKAAFRNALSIFQNALTKGLTEKSCTASVAAFKTVAKENCLLPEALYNVGVIYGECKQYSKAKETLNDLLKRHPGHEPSVLYLAALELESGNAEAAVTIVDHHLYLNEDPKKRPEPILKVAAVFENHGNKGDLDALEKAKHYVHKALTMDAEHLPSLLQLSNVYISMAEVAKDKSFLLSALRVCEQAIALNPAYGPAYHVLANVRQAQGDTPKAVAALLMAIERKPVFLQTHLNLGALYLDIRDYKAAKKTFEKAVGQWPKSYDAHMGLGVALRGLSDFEGAAEEYNKAKGINPQRTDYIYNLCVLETDYVEWPICGYEAKCFQTFVNQATDEHKKVGPGATQSWYDKAANRINRHHCYCGGIPDAEKDLAVLQKMAEEQQAGQKLLDAQMAEAEALAKTQTDTQRIQEEALEKELEKELEAAVQDSGQ